MADNPKKIIKQSFEGGRDTDSDNNNIPANSFRRMLNMRIFAPGTEGKAVAIMGNTKINTLLPPGNNKCIGKVKDEENDCFYYCIQNDQGYHTVYKFDNLSSLTTVILQSKTDSNGIDILRWSPLKQYRINHIDIIANKLFTCVDGLNKAVKFNMNKAVDKTSSGYGLIIFEDFIRAYKQTAVYAPTAAYITDTTRNANNLYGNLFKFTTRFKYDDKEESNWSDWSVVPKPGQQSYTGINAITFDNNCIELTVATGNQLVTKIEIAVQANSTAGGVENSTFFICAVLDKAELRIADNSTYVYRFYNDGSFIATNQDKINRNYSFLPRVPRAQSFVKSAMTYTNFEEGWPVVQADLSVSLRLDDLYLPPDTENKLTDAKVLVELVSVDRHQDSFLSGSRYNTVTKFTIGAEVKRGNVFYIAGSNGDSDNYNFSYTAKAGDTAAIVASYFKAYLRGIGRGYPDAGSQISGEGTDGFGNVYFNYGYLGQYKQAQTIWTGWVTQVSYISLKDSGLSLQMIPYGCTTNYGVVYVDDDGRESLAYTSAVSVIRTPYITEIGSYKRPVHVLSINHTPPPLARYWKLVRTPQQHGLEILVQKVVPVTTDNTSDYLDLVVGSLFTYQKLHPNTILKYEFAEGDRIRIIKNVDTDTLYSGYFETEVLSYKDTVTVDVNENITLNGTTTVTVAGAAKTAYIGRALIVDGIEREIIAASGNTYTIDAIIGSGTSMFASYSVIDRRGTIRIKAIPGLSIADNSLVELFKPQSLAISADYQIFNDCGQKFEVLGYGTATPYHAGSVQNQTSSQPAIVEISLGDAYIRDRELPINNIVPGTQVLVSRVVDTNYSDFYVSDMKDLGRVYPQDNGAGVVHFGSRTRYSGNYIEDTSVNGLNDFDNLDRVDNNDSYGDILATRFLNNRLYTFKPYKDAYIPVSHTMTIDSNGSVLSVQSGKLLNEIQYFAFEGGIGNNPESIFIYENWIYHSSVGTLSFIRLGGEGVEPISSIFKFDSGATDILEAVTKYNLPVLGEYQVYYGVAIWSVQSYVEYIINGGFNAGQWKTFSDLLPDGYTYEVTQQPATGTVTYDTGLKSFLVTGTALGADYFLYRPVISPGVYGAVKKQCINTVQPPNRPTLWRAKEDTAYCVVKKQVVINYVLSEQASPFIDGNLYVTANGVNVSPFPLYSSASGTTHVLDGDEIVVTAQAELSNTGTNPKLHLNIKKDGVVIYDNAVDNAPPPTVSIGDTFTAGRDSVYDILCDTYSDDVYLSAEINASYRRNNCGTGYSGTAVPIFIAAGTYTSLISQVDADNQAQIAAQAEANSEGSCFVDSTLSTLLVDYTADTNSDLCAYVSTPALSETDQIVTGTIESPSGPLQQPDDGTPYASCHALSSDKLGSSSPGWRFGFNLAYFISKYTGTLTSIEFTIRGRRVTSGVCGGSYAVRDMSEGVLDLVGTTGARIPTVTSGSSSPVGFSSHIVSGADGTVGVTVGSPILKLTYNFTTNTITATTY